MTHEITIWEWAWTRRPWIHMHLCMRCARAEYEQNTLSKVGPAYPDAVCHECGIGQYEVERYKTTRKQVE